MGRGRPKEFDRDEALDEAVELFGVERCMFASNFPVDSLFSDYKTLWLAYDEITSDFSVSERSKLFFDNAEKYYRI